MGWLVSKANRLFHRTLDLVLRVDGRAALNLGRPAMAGNGDIAGELLAAVQAMKAAAFDLATGRINYELLREGDSYQRYRACTARLMEFQPQTLVTRQQRLAFWISLYNALIIDAVIAFDPGKGVREDLGFFRRAAYIVGGLRYSADDIEHGILRGNRRHFHPAIRFPQFGPDDPRLLHAICAPDPRVHCALVCGTRSCPPFQTYQAERIDEQLDAAARNFVNGGAVVVDRDNKEACLSPIFKWYRIDFESADGVIGFILRYLDDGPARDALQKGQCRLRYQPYDWSLNAI